MTSPDVGGSEALSITLDLDGTRVAELRRWASIGRRSIEQTVLAAIDEYLAPIETAAHGGCPPPGYWSDLP